MQRLLCASWLLCLLGIGSPAAAQLTERPLPSSKPIGIVYPSTVSRTTANTREDDEIAEQAIASVEQALRALGYQVLGRSDVIQKLVDAGVDAGVECPMGVLNCPSAEVLKALDLGAVVLIAIWWDRRPADITIEATTADATGIAKGKLDGAASKTVPELVTRALKDLRNGKAVEIRINAVPIGAEVRLDGELLGQAPVSAKARPGPHEVMLSYPDYVTTSRQFDVPRGAEGPVPIDITLERTIESAARAPAVPLPPSSRASPAWDYAVGGVLVGGAVALAIGPIQTIAQNTECDGPARAGTCERVQFGSRSALLLGASAVALAGAVYVFAATPIRTALSYDGESAHVQVTGSF